MNVSTINVTITNEHDEEEDIVLPASYVVCGKCEGKGSHMTPSIANHAITQEEWEHDWDEESRERYLNGGYDVTCHRCDGLRVVAKVNEKYIEDHGTDKQRKALQVYLEDISNDRLYNSMVASEIAYGC